MDSMAISSASAPQWNPAGTVPRPIGEEASMPPDMEDLRSRLSQEEDEAKSLVEMMREAREQAEEQRKALEKFYKSNHTNYGDAPIEAYSRLARAKTRTQVNAASGYARRRIAQLKRALHQDGDNASAIRSSISQLQKALNRAEKKKRDLDREGLLESRRKRSLKEEEARQAQRLRLELQRRKSQRMIREAGYLREAEIDKRFQAYAVQTQLELRRQVQSLTAGQPPSLEAAIAQYTAAAQPAVQPAPEGGAPL